MIRRAFTLAGLLLALVAAPAAFAGGAPSAVAGKDTFLKHCAACHGPDGMGKEAVAKMMKTTIPPLPSPEVQKLTDAEMTKAIREGKGKMQPVKDLSNADVANLIAFTRSLAKK